MAADYYQLLGVARDADAATIKKAYRRLAMKYHPDRNSGEEAEEKFKEIQGAYAILSNSEKRAAYDRFGEAGVSGAAGGRPGAGGRGGFGGFTDGNGFALAITLPFFDTFFFALSVG